MNKPIEVHFRVLLMIVFCAFSGGSWYCKGSGPANTRNEDLGSPCRSPECSLRTRQRDANLDDNAAYLGNLPRNSDMVLERLFVSFTNSKFCFFTQCMESGIDLSSLFWHMKVGHY